MDIEKEAINTLNNIVERAITAFLSSDVEEALNVCLEHKESFCTAEYAAVFSMLSYLEGNMSRGIRYGECYRNTFRAAGEENIFASFLVAFGNTNFNNLFREKHGRKLPLFDLELVYTTEDEVFVPRIKNPIGTLFNPFGLELFWRCTVDGTSRAMNEFMREYPEYTDNFGNMHKTSIEMLEQRKNYKRSIMEMNTIITSQINKEDSVLDLGSGLGMLAYMLHTAGKYDDAVFVDIIPGYIEGCKKYANQYLKRHNYNFIVGDILDSSWLKSLGTFDVIIACDLVEHLYNDEFDKLFETAMSMLNDGGRLYIQTPCGLRFITRVTDNEGNIIRPEFLGKGFPHVSEKSIGYFRKKFEEEGYSYKILERRRIILEVYK